MNVNEVIANRANEMLGGDRGAKNAGASQRPRQHGPVVERRVPDRHAHRGRARDRAPPAPGAQAPARRSRRQGEEFADIVKIGRTHLQDATPLTLGQEFSGYAAQVALGIARVEAGLPRPLRARPGRHGGRHRPQRAPRVRRDASPPRWRRITGLPFTSAPNKFEALAVPRRHRVRARRAGQRRRRPQQDRQRHPPAGLGPALGARRAEPARERARLLDHARQGQPDPGRGPDHGVRAGDRQEHHHRGGRRPGALRAQRLQAGDRRTPCCSRSGCSPTRPQLRRQMRRRHRGRPRPHRRADASAR